MRRLKAIIAFIQNVWLICGVSLLLICLVNAAIGLGFLIRDRLRGERVLTVPIKTADWYSDRPWVDAYYEEFEGSRANRWQPYLYWRRKSFSGQYINVGTDGNRRTIAPHRNEGDSAPHRKIFMFGGSTMWGTGARDDFTIPSLLAKELQKSEIAAEIVNFGEGGHVSTQEVIALMLELRGGRVPDVVIFYDGINDTFSAFQQHAAGTPQNEFNRAVEFNLSSTE